MEQKDDIKELLQSQNIMDVPSDLEDMVMNSIQKKKARRNSYSLLKMSLVYSFLIIMYTMFVILMRDFISVFGLFQDIKIGLLLTLVIYTIYSAVSIYGDYLERNLSTTS